MGWGGFFSLWLVASAIGVPFDGLEAEPYLALDTIIPDAAGENQVRWWRFDWRTADLKPLERGAAVRLFFYESEREIARVAASAIEETFREYEKLFRFTPQKTPSIILYNSHFEFESSNAFPVREHLRGATRKREGTMALSYGADHARFLEVLRHEVAHVFTLAKVKATALAVGIASPISDLPNWFLEGVAQEAAVGDLTPEAMAALVAAFNEDDLPDIVDRGGSSFERVYLFGHAQVRFLEEVYGRGTWLAILERLPGLAAKDKDSWRSLLTRVTGVNSDQIEAAWRAWAERRTRPFRSWKQQAVFLSDDKDGRIDELAISPDGRTLLYRSFDEKTGQASLWLRDVDEGNARVRVTSDKRVGLESLHPFSAGVVAMGDGVLVYSGRRGVRDRLFFRRWHRRQTGDELRIELEDGVELDPGRYLNFVELRHLTFAPDGASLAFVALDGASGRRDVWGLALPEAGLTKITNDASSERDLAWGAEGLYWVSDATSDRRAELFLHSLTSGQTRRLTSFTGGEPSSPSPVGIDRVLFTASATGLSQSYLRTTRGMVRLTAYPTGISQAVFDRAGRLLGVTGSGQQARLIAVEARSLEAIAVHGWADASPVVEPLPQAFLKDDEPYRALSARNLSLTNAQLAASSGPFVEAQFSLADKMRDRVFLLGGRYARSLEEKAARLMYLDRSRRLGWAAAAFLDNALQIDPTHPVVTETFLLRRFGIQGRLYWPFGRYARLEAFLAPQGWGTSDFATPSGSFARRYAGTSFALTAGARYALDTLVYRPKVGPTRGTSAILSVSGTGLSRVRESFLTLGFDVQRYQPLSEDFPRIYLLGRLSAMLQPGGVLASQFFLPPAWNIRAYGGADITVVARDYMLATLELRLPLLPERPGWPSLEAMLGADAGSLFFAFADAWSNRVADVAFGLNLGLGFLTLRLHLARAIDIGGVSLPTGLQTHVSIWSPGPSL